MNLLDLIAWCLICATSVTTYKRKDRHIVKPKAENFVEPTVNSKVTSLRNKEKELKFDFWQQQSKNFMEHVSKTKGPEQSQFQMRHKKNHNNKSNILAFFSVNGEIYRPNYTKEDEEVTEKETPSPLENGLITSAMSTEKFFAKNSEPIEEYKELSDISHLIDDALGLSGKNRPDILTEWLSQPKREVIAVKDMKCAPGEIKLTKTYLCVPCTVFVDLEDKASVCSLKDFKRVCVESWTNACGLNLPKSVRLRTPRDYDYTSY